MGQSHRDFLGDHHIVDGAQREAVDRQGLVGWASRNLGFVVDRLQIGVDRVAQAGSRGLVDLGSPNVGDTFCNGENVVAIGGVLIQGRSCEAADDVAAVGVAVILGDQLFGCVQNRGGSTVTSAPFRTS